MAASFNEVDMNENNSLKFKDKIAFVTGASSGIGAAIAEALGNRGASVAFCGHILIRPTRQAS